MLYRANVDGTRHLLEAAAEAGAERIVYTSSVGALGIPKDGTPGDETTPVPLEDMVGAYKASKFLAERVADEWAARGAPVVIVNPSAPIGPWDVKPTPTGQMIVDFLDGKMLGSLDTGLNVVHVRDVARGHLLAAEHGRVGERYILGHRNLSLLEIFRVLAALTGVPAPRFRVPYAVAWMAAAAMEGAARVTRRAPRVPLTAVRMARKRMFFSAAKAVRELGLPQTPAETGARATPSPGSSAHGYARADARARHAPRHESRAPVRLPAHPQEPLQLLLRVPLPAARPARRHLRLYAFCRIVDDAVDLGQDRTAQRAELAALARGDRAGLRGARRSIRPASGCRWPWPVPDPAHRARGDHRRRRDGPRPPDLRDVRGALPVLLPGGLRRRPLLHRDLRLHGSAGPRVRGQPRASRSS